MLKKWNELPKDLQSKQVKEYYNVLLNKKFQLFIKRILDLIFSFLFIILLMPIYIIISIIIKFSSKGPILFKQQRITKYGKIFKIWKFRTMVVNADKIGSLVTSSNDPRITKIGGFLRKSKLDELPQLFNILKGDMSFVGTRPEVEKYVNKYTDEMKATLLMPAGITSTASYLYKDESSLINSAKDIDKIYIDKILPDKMKYNLEDIKQFSIINDIKIIIKTVVSVLKRD